MTLLHHDDDNEVREFPTSTPMVGEGATATGGAGKVGAVSTKTSRAGGTNATTTIPCRNGNHDGYAYDFGDNNDNIEGGGVYYDADDLREQYEQALNAATAESRLPPPPTLNEMMMKMVPPNNDYGSGDTDDGDNTDIPRKRQLYFGICCL